jgi:predicted transcriptional regulator
MNHFEYLEELFFSIIEVHRFSDVRQARVEMHIAELLVPDSSPFEVVIATAKLKNINRQVVVKFWQKLFKQEVIHY